MTMRGDEPLAKSRSRLLKQLDKYEPLVGLLAILLLVVIFLFPERNDTATLFDASLPNAIAALGVFLVLFVYSRYIGKSRADETRELLDLQAARIDRMRRPAGVIDFHSNWGAIDSRFWREFIDDAASIDVVMNFSNSFFESNQAAFVAAIHRGASFNLYLPDPGGFDPDSGSLSGQDRQRLTELARAYNMQLNGVRERIARSASTLVGFGASHAQVTVRLLPRLSYAVVRTDDRKIVLSHYDQFPVDHASASALVLRPGADDNLQSYWARQFSDLANVAPTPVEKLLELRQGF